jgi:hypothetical protein
METIELTEYIGYLASIVIMISFLMKKIITLRIINLIGGILFIVYGILLSMSIPIIVTNSFVVGVNFYYLVKHFRSK